MGGVDQWPLFAMVDRFHIRTIGIHRGNAKDLPAFADGGTADAPPILNGYRKPLLDFHLQFEVAG